MEKLEATNKRVEQLNIEGSHSYKIITQLSTDVRSAQNSIQNLSQKIEEMTLIEIKNIGEEIALSLIHKINKSHNN